jgi:hypothetical protein
MSMLETQGSFISSWIHFPDFEVSRTKNAHTCPRIDTMLKILEFVEHIYVLSIPVCLLVIYTR